jgi:hypothetical protein
MCNSAVPLLLLLAGPLVYFAFRLGGLRVPAIRWALGALIFGILVVKSPPEGFDGTSLDRVKLVLAASMAIVLSLVRGTALSEVRRFLVGVIAGACVLAHFNFFAFHGGGTFIHLHDVAHYYLGSKYAVEIPYGELYSAMVIAELESHDGRPPVGHARDLRTGAVVPIEKVRLRGDSVRPRFDAVRWQAFRADVEAIHELMGPRFATVLNDHGYNPTPVWSLIGGAVANRISAGSRTGIRALTLADPALLAIAFLALVWSFGFETACVAAAYWGVLYGAVFNWVGGAFLRNLWFATTIVGVSLLHRSKALAAGACLATAASLRVFPVFFLLGSAANVVAAALRWRTIPRDDARMLTACGVVAASLILATLALGGGLEAWLGFRRNLGAHTDALTSNFVGIPAWLRYAVLGIGLGGEASVYDLFAPAGATYRALVAVILLAATLAAARLAVRTDDPPTRVALGLLPIVFGLQLAHYYYVALALLVLAHRSRPDRLAALFAAEAMLYVLALFETHFSVMCLFRGLVTAYLLVALWFDDLRDDVRSLAALRSPASSGAT